MREIDLHVHTTGSDSTCTPREAVRLAKELGLRAIAVTDHDTALGCAEAAQEGNRLGLEVIPGIEISTKYDTPVHVLVNLTLAMISGAMAFAYLYRDRHSCPIDISPFS